MIKPSSLLMVYMYFIIMILAISVPKINIIPRFMEKVEGEESEKTDKIVSYFFAYKYLSNYCSKSLHTVSSILFCIPTGLFLVSGLTAWLGASVGKMVACAIIALLILLVAGMFVMMKFQIFGILTALGGILGIVFFATGIQNPILAEYELFAMVIGIFFSRCIDVSAILSYSQITCYSAYIPVFGGWNLVKAFNTEYQ